MDPSNQIPPAKWTYRSGWRWYPVPAAFLALVLAFYVGATTKMNEAEALSLEQFWEEVLGTIDSPINIFLNNCGIALAMLIPILGAPFAMYVGYSSGLVIAALSQTRNADPVLLLALTVLNPIGVMEFVAYAISITQGLLIVYAAYRKHLTDEARNAAITVLIVSAILFAEAILEFEVIKGALPQ
ncbi:MAG: stage II sporulation protein M [Candidatus Brockarchaeota archaeon]|nr:stage II sporulation protein M [Candidatus Brockarchaeota archaeon]